MFQPDVIVVGGGLIGLSCATAVAREGFRVRVISSKEPGVASAASAGILAPTVGRSPAAVRALGTLARDMFPSYLRSLGEWTGRHVPLDRSGVLEVALGETEAAALRASLDHGSEWIDGHALHHMEPALSPAAGAAFHAYDGAVDVPALLEAVRADADRARGVSLTDGRVTRIEPGRGSITVGLEEGERVEAPYVVVAAGAWSARIAGLPRPIPITPMRGQMVSLGSINLGHVVMGPRGYLVRRGDRTMVGSTLEDVGFEAGTTSDGAAVLEEVARELSSAFRAQSALDHWAGLRPMTPDLLPLVGRDRDCAGLHYACGHSKNGILLAPLTAQVIAELIASGSTSLDLTPYAPARFDP